MKKKSTNKTENKFGAVSPVYVLCGFLGSGKTTLLIRLLSHFLDRGVRPSVLMNEFGEIECNAVEVEAVNIEIERNESYQSLQAALKKLPEKYRTPIVLKYFEYLSLDEIAAILGRPVGTVKSLVHRGIAKLREDQGLRDAHSDIILEATRISVENR